MEVAEAVADGADAAAEGAVELAFGGSEGLVALGSDEIGDGFRLGQIDAAVEEGAEGVLTRCFGERASTQAGLQGGFGGEAAAVALELDDIFAGVAAGAAKINCHRLVAGLTALRIAHLAENHPPFIGRAEGSWSLPGEIGDVEGAGTAEADDGDTAADGGGDGSDRAGLGGVFHGGELNAGTRA